MFSKLPYWLIHDIKYKWEHLVIRKWINQNPKVVYAVMGCSVLLFLVILIFISMPFGDSVKAVKIKKDWYYDLNTGELFVDKTGLSLPVVAPSGPLPDGNAAGVRAYVFSYSDTSDEAEHFVGFLEKLDPNRPTHSKSGKEEMEPWGYGKLIRRVEDANWCRADSSEGRAILRDVFSPNEEGLQPFYYPAR